MENLLPIIIIIFLVLLLFTVIIVFSCYHRCPADRIMVVYGYLGKNKEGEIIHAKCISGGGAIVWPILQDYKFLDLKPISVDIHLKDAICKDNINVAIEANFKIKISNEVGIMQNAAERLLGLSHDEIRDLAKGIFIGTLRLVIEKMNRDEINYKNNQFISEISRKVETELNKIGLKLMSIIIDRIIIND